MRHARLLQYGRCCRLTSANHLLPEQRAREPHTAGPTPTCFPTSAMQYGPILLGTVLIHELGHALAARRVGGHADGILLWPLGGLAYVGHDCGPKGEPHRVHIASMFYLQRCSAKAVSCVGVPALAGCPKPLL